MSLVLGIKHTANCSVMYARAAERKKPDVVAKLFHDQFHDYCRLPSAKNAAMSVAKLEKYVCHHSA